MRNYFNYFTEVEEYFVQKRGKNLLVSPLDWCLIELWKENDVPLQVVLRGIDRSFESARRSRRKPPSTLAYCHPAVMEAYEEYNEAMLGAPTDASSPRDEQPMPDVVLKHLADLEKRLAARDGEEYRRAGSQVAALRIEAAECSAMSLEELDRALSQSAAALAETLQERQSAAERRERRARVRKELRIFRKRLSAEMYDQIFRNYLVRRVLEEYQLPEFGILQLGGEL